MSPRTAAEGAGRGGRRRTWLRRAGRVAALVLLGSLALLVALYLLRERLLSPLIAREARDFARERFGAELEVERIGGNWFGELELEGVDWRVREPGLPLQRLAVGALRARYSLPALLRGRDDWLEAVEARDVQARVDLSQPRETAAEEQQDGPRRPLPATLPRVDVQGLDLHLDLPGERTLAAEGGRLEVGAPDGAQPIQLAFDRARYAGPDLGELRGSLRAEGAWDERVLTLEAVTVDGERVLHEGRVDLTRWDQGQLDFALAASAFDGEARLRGALDGRAADLSLRVEGLDAGEAWSFAQPRSELEVGGNVDARAELALRPDEPPAGTFQLAAAGVQAGPRQLERLDLRGAFEGGTVAVEELRAVQGENLVEARDLRVPLEEGDPLAVLRGSSGVVRAELTDLPSLLAAGEGEGEGVAGRVPPHRLTLTARLEGRRAAIERAALRTEGGGFELRSGELVLGDTREDLLRGARLDLDLALDFADLSPLGPILGTAAWSGSAEGDLRLQGPLTDLEGEVDVQGRDVVAAGREVGDVRALARIDDERVQVERLAADTPYGQVELTGGVALGTGELDGVQLSVASDALGEIAPQVFGAGSARVEARLGGGWRAPTGSVRLSAAGVVSAARPDLGVEALELAAELAPGAAQVLALDARAAGVALHLAGTVEHEAWGPPYRVELAELEVEREGLALALADPVAIAVDPPALSFEGMELAGTAGRLRLSLDAGEEGLFAELEAPSLEPMPLIAPLVPPGFDVAGARLDLRLAHTSGDTRLEVTAAIERLQFAEGAPPFTFRAEGAVEGERTRLDVLALHSDPDIAIDVSGSLPLDPFQPRLLREGEVDLEARLLVPDLDALPWALLGVQLPLAGDLAAEVELHGTWEDLRGSAELDAEGIAFRRARGGRAFAFGPAQASGLLVLDEALRLERLRLIAEDQAAIEARGSWAVEQPLVAALSGEAGRLLDAPLDLEAVLRSVDLAFLGALSPALRRVGGEVRATLAVGGTPREPRIEGQLDLRQGELRAFGEWPGLDDLAATVTFDGERVGIQSLTGELGAGPFAVTGEVLLDDPVRFDVRALGYEVLLASTPTLRLRADAELALQGPLDTLQLTGDLKVRDGRWSKDLDYFAVRGGAAPSAGPPFELFSFEDPPFAGMTLDVSVGYVKPFMIDNNLVRAEVRPDLRLSGSGRTPELTGTVFADEGRIYLPSSRLRLMAGTVQFTRAQPLVPLLDVLLETRMRGYDISVRLEGTPTEPEVALTSVPPLSNEDILVLILSGQAPDTGLGSAAGAAAAQDVALFVGKDVISRWFSRDDGEGGESFLERVEYQSGGDVSQTGAETQEVRIRLSAEEAREGRTVYLRGEKDTYDRINLGLRWVFRID